MTKKEYNLNYKSLINDSKVDFDMLIQGYALLDKQVGKYAYLKKKYANSGVSNESNIYEFNTAIQKRNAIEKVLKSECKLTVKDIKNCIDGIDVVMTHSNCDELVELVRSNFFELVT